MREFIVRLLCCCETDRLSPISELAIEARKASKLEQRVERFVLEPLAPIPRAREAAINAGTRFEEIIATAAIEMLAGKAGPLTGATLGELS